MGEAQPQKQNDHSGYYSLCGDNLALQNDILHSPNLWQRRKKFSRQAH
jgi:hypothetical protein